MILVGKFWSQLIRERTNSENKRETPKDVNTWNEC